MTLASLRESLRWLTPGTMAEALASATVNPVIPRAHTIALNLTTTL